MITIEYNSQDSDEDICEECGSRMFCILNNLFPQLSDWVCAICDFGI